MSLVLVTAPAEEPISLTDAKSHLRLDDDTENDLVTDLIQSARDWAEGETGRALLSQQWQYVADCFPECSDGVSGAIKLGRAPLISVQSITYVDTNGATQTLSPSQYIVDTAHVLGRIGLAYGTVWPTTRRQPGAVTVAFTAGYADPSAVPRRIRRAMLLMLGELYQNREASVDGVRANVNPIVRGMLDRYVLPVVA